MATEDKLKEKIPPTDQAGMETDGTGAPDSGHVEELSSSEATEVAAESVEEATGTVDGSQKEILNDQELAADAKAEPSADHTPHKPLHPAEVASGVTQNLNGGIQQLDSAAQPLGGMISGSVVPAASVDGSNISTFPKKKDLENEVLTSRSHIKGSVNNSSTWENLVRIRNTILEKVRGQKKAA